MVDQVDFVRVTVLVDYGIRDDRGLPVYNQHRQIIAGEILAGASFTDAKIRDEAWGDLKRAILRFEAAPDG